MAASSFWHKLRWLLFLGWLLWLIFSLLRLCRLINRDKGRLPSGTVPSFANRQPDPMIYSQGFLMAQGLAVTWENPDIHLELASAPGIAVASSALVPGTDYVVFARIWNNSTTAPVAYLPVKFSWLEFGITTISHDIGITNVDLSVKGGSSCPVFASMPWGTPREAGHYCLVVELQWTDDAEPGNNIGQHNTVVQPLNSPRAAFRFLLRNPGPDRRLISLQTDAYRIPPPQACPREEKPEQRERRRAATLLRHNRDAWPIPEGWHVTVTPGEIALNTAESATIAVDVTAPDGFSGSQSFNVNAFDGGTLLGGVTLIAEGTA